MPDNGSSSSSFQGQIEIRTTPEDSSGEVKLYRWVPPPDLLPELPADFRLELRCHQTPRGRCFTVAESHVPMAFAAGLAVLIKRIGLPPEQGDSYRSMWLLWQRLVSSREHLGNDFGHAASLVLKRQAGGRGQADHILPENVGLTATGEGKTWTVKRLIKAGEQYLREREILEPTQQDRIWAGFTQAASCNPLYLPLESSEGLIRMALVSPSDQHPSMDASEQKATITEQIEDRLLLAISRHLDDSQKDFDDWFWGGHNTLVQQLAKQRKADGGEKPQGVVRQVLSELGWRAYRHVGDCIHVAMRTFRRGLGSHLTAEEHRLFERMHERQDYLGGLPAILLGKRLPQLKFILPQVYENSDNSKAIPVMYRLLDWYGELARSRRQADRRGQASRTQNSPTGRGAMDVALTAPAAMSDSTTDRGNSILDDLAETLARQKNLECECCNSHWGVTVCNRGEEHPTLELGCRTCHTNHEVTVPMAELRQIMVGGEQESVNTE